MELWKRLTNRENMPRLTEDLILEHIKPTREYRKFVYELDKTQKAELRNWVYYVIKAAEDLLEIIDDADVFFNILYPYNP
jgi:hypothetical protein